jgi:hypothetical protein
VAKPLGNADLLAIVLRFETVGEVAFLEFAGLAHREFFDAAGVRAESPV